MSRVEKKESGSGWVFETFFGSVSGQKMSDVRIPDRKKFGLPGEEKVGSWVRKFLGLSI